MTDPSASLQHSADIAGMSPADNIAPIGHGTNIGVADLSCKDNQTVLVQLVHPLH